MPLLVNKTIRLFLDSIGRREEYEYYLQKFHNASTSVFALLCPHPDGFEEMAPMFTFDLNALLRLELHPLLVLCGERAGWMRDLLMREDHPYDSLQINGNSPACVSPEQVDQFACACRTAECTGILVAPELSLQTMLLNLLPSVSRRVHLLRQAGPLHAANGSMVPYYYVARTDSPKLRPEDQSVVSLAEELLAIHPALHFSVASPWNLLEELFTVKGAGCVIRRGSQLRVLHSVQHLDQDKLIGLLEQSFGRKLARVEFLTQTLEVIVDEAYRGAVLLESTDCGMYLSKFAVGVEARGSGLAQELWDLVVARHPCLFWRCRRSNPVNSWYEKQADGCHAEGEWRVFWRGVPADHLSQLILYCLARPEDFQSA